MKKYLQSTTVTTGLAIFAMLFGAGNLIFPLKLGINSGDQTYIGLIGFILSGVLLPLAGLVSMVFFDGDYRAFFYRIGKIPGVILVFFCMLIIGPLFVMPRIIALSYTLMQPFIPDITRLTFSTFFGILTFICCYKKNAILGLLGKILSPLKLISLFTIIGLGFWYWQPPLHVSTSVLTTFLYNFKEGYNTLDLMGALFFASIILTILKRTLDSSTANNSHKLATIMLHGGLIGGALLAIVYVGMGYLGAFHGQGLNHLGPDEMFITTVRRILGDKGALFISVTILVACLSTMIALATVVSEYLRTDILKKRVNYTYTLIAVLALTAFLARYRLDALLAFYGPIMDITYPVLIVLTFMNLAYKLWGFTWVRMPVFATFIGMTIWITHDSIIKPLYHHPMVTSTAEEPLVGL